jgi:hypothetical protein
MIYLIIVISLSAGVALLLAAAFFGYMLALLQRRVLGMYSNGDVSIKCLTLSLFCEGKKICTFLGRLTGLANMARTTVVRKPAVMQQAST